MECHGNHRRGRASRGSNPQANLPARGGASETSPGIAARSRVANRQFASSADHGLGSKRYFRGDLGCNIVPVQFLEPQRHSQIFFMRAVCASSRVMP